MAVNAKHDVQFWRLEVHRQPAKISLFQLPGHLQNKARAGGGAVFPRRALSSTRRPATRQQALLATKGSNGRSSLTYVCPRLGSCP